MFHNANYNYDIYSAAPATLQLLSTLHLDAAARQSPLQLQAVHCGAGRKDEKIDKAYEAEKWKSAQAACQCTVPARSGFCCMFTPVSLLRRAMDAGT
jgi:hypothetical protein